MFHTDHVLNIWLMLLVISQSSAVSFNQPEFCPSATWNSAGITFANNNTVGELPYGIFINNNNTVFVANRANNLIQVWFEGNSMPTTIVVRPTVYFYSIFVSSTNDIYINNNQDGVDKWSLNSLGNFTTLSIDGQCCDLFIDSNNSLYCSLYWSHKVIKRSLNSSDNQTTSIAGTDCSGFFSDRLANPQGIYVDINFALYVADSGNDRIQYFEHGQLNGITIAGKGAPGTIILDYPTDITLDAEGYIFIVDNGNHRILRSGLNGYECIAGCSGSPGSTASRLFYPQSMAFDRYGNIFVTDRYNNRIQKFYLATNSCNATTASQQTSISPINTDDTENITEISISPMITPTPNVSFTPRQQTISYNRPKLCTIASWNPTAVTFANHSMVGWYPYSLFVNTNNTVYVADRIYNRIQVWLEGSVSPTNTIFGNISNPFSLFVTSSGDIYVDNGNSYGQVDKWSDNATSRVPIMYITQSCYGLFIDINNTLYCSLRDLHQVVIKSLDDTSTSVTIVAGTGCYGRGSIQLTNPNGIFVDSNFNLYVADSNNGRIQLFQSGQRNGTTVAGYGAPNTITLYYPTGVVLDADGYLFIVDTYNHRIVGSGPTGFRCIIGCSGTSGAASNQLYYPQTMAFDSYGNIFVADTSNHRIQKFLLKPDSCDISYNQPKLCPFASWNSTGITFANSSIIGSQPNDIFIDTTNAVYASSQNLDIVRIWPAGSTIPTRNLTGYLNDSHGIFVTINGDIYVDNGKNGHIVKWAVNSTNSITVTNITSICFSLFIDINNTLYCSLSAQHQVVKTYLDDNGTNMSIFAAGTGSPGSASNMLNSPKGVFVTINFDLYVADCGNNRIQLFPSGQSSGTTIVGNHSSNTFILNCPSGIILDADNYLFIADSNNHRIVRTGPNGLQCVVGCTSSPGSGLNRLNSPQSLAFDDFGNLFVVDRNNSRIQKFLLTSTSCSMPATSVASTISTNPTADLTLITSTSSTAITSSIRTSTTSSLSSNQSCFAPILTLIPSTSSFSLPLQFRRSQDFYISSYFQLTCNISLSTITKWTIYICNSSCIFPIQTGQLIDTTSSELFIPARALAYGIYQLTLTVSMTIGLHLKSSSSAYVRITPSGITANLVQFGTSMITRGYQQDLILDPGSFSVDPDLTIFNASNWKYEYYCRIYGHYNFPNIQGRRLTIDDPRNDSNNPSCLSPQTSNQRAWEYIGPANSIKSTLKILSNSLPFNSTYQFVVYMENLRNSTLQATGFLLVKVENTQPQLIVVACVISTLCAPNLEYQFVNPTTQVALFSMCIGNCTIINNITWTVYYGQLNSSSNMVQWIRFNQYQNNWFFGSNTTNFTATNNLFLSNPLIEYWRFEVVYSFPRETSLSALNFIINKPPENGSCSINPRNGTTSTLFTISCANWEDQDGIKDYSYYIWTTDRSKLVMVGFTSISTIQMRLPAGNDNTSIVNLIVQIRDTLGCITESNFTSITVIPDTEQINDLINNLQVSTDAANNNPIIQILAGGNQNIVGQVLTSLSQVFNKMNTENLDKAVSNGIPAASISISSLENSIVQSNNLTLNTSALVDFNKELNRQANTRDYLISFTTNLKITTANSIKLQASTLSELTQSTNQLTRTTSLLVAQKCHQLASALYSMAMKISYEDVLTAANHISQCASNVMTAINGPLQQRTVVLDLDASRANTFPQDYDTDLESEWSNLNLFSDGHDFSSETISKNRNFYYQKQTAKQITDEVTQTISLITSALNIHLNIGQYMTVKSPTVYMSLETVSFQSLSNKRLHQTGNTYIQIPANLQINQTNNGSISLRSTVQPLALADQSSSQSITTNLSRLISLTILDQNGDEISIQTNLTHPIEMMIPRDPSAIIPSMTLQNVTSLNSTPHQLLFNLHFVNITNSLPISIHFEIHPLNRSLGYLFIYKFDSSPILNSSVNQIDGWALLCTSNLTNESLYTYFLNNQQTVGHQSVIFGLRELNSSEIDRFCSNSSINTPPITNQRFNFTSDYELRIYTSGCYYLDSNNKWQSDGLIVGPLTNHHQTQCFSTHLTTFAGGFIILPSPINWNYVFSHADFLRNKTIYLTVIIVTILYLLLIIYARYKDRKDSEKLRITYLPDNHQSDQYFYQILIFTGRRKDSGTKSKVHFILSGDNDDTQVRTLADPDRTILQRGGIDAFILAVPKSLGPLNYVRIWHDNTGQGGCASWFLKYVIVRDLQTMEKFHFICQRWLAVEKDDGKIERVLFAANELEKRELSYLLSKQTYHKISEDHLWFSIFSRPIANKFTRVQRCTCCFVLLFLSMLLNIMYYDLSKETKINNSTVSLSLGPFFISSQQIIIGITVELLSLIPSLLLVELFRRLRSRQPKVSSLRQKLYEINSSKIIADETKNTKSKTLTFPWWFIFIAYGFSILLIAMSILFIIARGIEFGDLKTQQWLTSILTGLFSSILLTQPLKILSLAIFFAICTRNKNEDKEAGEHMDMEPIDLTNNQKQENKSLFTYRPTGRFERLNEAEVACARDQRLKDIQMWSIIREIFIYLTFFIILCFVTYSNRDQNAFRQVQHLRRFFLNSRQIDNDYTKISTVHEYWSWLETSFVPNIRAQEWYNNDPPQYLNGFINDKSNRLIGWPIMRQIRVKSILCPHQKIGEYCKDNHEDTRSFEPGWTNETNIQISNSSFNRAFQYRSSDELDTYNGGGYVYEFRGRLLELKNNLSKLHQYEWIDKQTHSIIIQISLYNPNSQLFTSIRFLSEFLSTGGIRCQLRIEPFYLYLIFTSTLQLIAFIFYIAFILYFIFIQAKSIIRLKCHYFKQLWSYIELGIIICSLTTFGIYILRYQQAKSIGALFKKTNGYSYVNLQLCIYLNNILTYLLGFSCFFSTIKILYLCRFNQRLLLFNQTLKYSWKALSSFGCMFSIIFIGFICLFYLLFNSYLSSCSSLFQTAEMLFEMTLMKFDAKELISASVFLGPFCFSLFIFIVVFICMSMFLSIINESFRHARENLNENQHISSLMWKKFQYWIGIKKLNQLEMFEIRDAQMRSQYIDPIEDFPNKIDQLLDALNRIYMTQTSGRL